MERSHIPLATWVWAAQIMSSSKKGFSAFQLHRMIGTNYETAWFLFHRLREAADAIRGGGQLGGEARSLKLTKPILAAKRRTSSANKRSGKRGPGW